MMDLGIDFNVSGTLEEVLGAIAMKAAAASAKEEKAEPAKVSLASVPTCDLVRELEAREGVEWHEIGPTASMTLKVDGPATVLNVTD